MRAWLLLSLSFRRSLVRPARSWAWTAARRCFSLRAPAALVATNVVLLEGGRQHSWSRAGPRRGGLRAGARVRLGRGWPLAELHRGLRPGGRAVVWDVDWATVLSHSRDTARPGACCEPGTSTSPTRRCRERSPTAYARPDSSTCAWSRTRSLRAEVTLRNTERRSCRSSRRSSRAEQGIGELEAEAGRRRSARADGTRRVLPPDHPVLLHSHENPPNERLKSPLPETRGGPLARRLWARRWHSRGRCGSGRLRYASPDCDLLASAQVSLDAPCSGISSSVQSANDNSRTRRAAADQACIYN